MKEFTKETESCGNGAALLLDILAAEGVEFNFGNPNTTEMLLMLALKEAPGTAIYSGPSGNGGGRDG